MTQRPAMSGHHARVDQIFVNRREMKMIKTELRGAAALATG